MCVGRYVIWVSIYPFLVSCHVVFREKGGGERGSEHDRSGGRWSSLSSYLEIAERKDYEKRRGGSIVCMLAMWLYWEYYVG